MSQQSKRILVVEDEEDNRRIVRDPLHMPGLVTLVDNQVQIDLLSQNQFSEELAMCLLKYCFG